MRVYDDRIIELENKVKDLKEQLQSLRSRSVQLVDMERKCCLEYVPSKGIIYKITNVYNMICIPSLAQTIVLFRIALFLIILLFIFLRK